MTMTTTAARARVLADEIRYIVSAATLASAIESETVADLLGQYESVLRARLGGDYPGRGVWEAAAALLVAEG